MNKGLIGTEIRITESKKHPHLKLKVGRIEEIDADGKLLGTWGQDKLSLNDIEYHEVSEELQGLCISCLSDNIEFDLESGRLEDYEYIFDWECNDCKTKGREVSFIEFSRNEPA